MSEVKSYSRVEDGLEQVELEAGRPGKEQLQLAHQNECGDVQ